MRQRNQTQASEATNRLPPTAAEMEQRLSGLGPLQLQLDGCRLTAPAPLRKRLGAHCGQQYVFSIWHGPRLRIIPQALWPSYLKSVRAEANDCALADDLVLRLRQTCATRSLDGHDRWDLPVSLARPAGLITAQNSVVLLPFRFWLEVLSSTVWDAFITQTLQRAHEADARPAGFEI